MTILFEDEFGVSRIAGKKRTSGAKALITVTGFGTAEAVPFVRSSS
jgi:hypothetical protein